MGRPSIPAPDAFRLFPGMAPGTLLSVSMLSLNKILPSFLLPLGLTLVLLLVGWRTRRWIWVGAAAALLYLASIFPVSRLLLHSLEQSYPELSVRDCPRAGAIVVLSGFCAEDRGADKVMNFGEASERFEAGALLWKAGCGERLWVMHDGEEFGAGRLRRELEQRGVELVAGIDVLGPVGNTADEARRVRSEAQKEGVTSIILVTTAWHMPRAMQLFRRTSLKITPFPVDYQTAKDLFFPPKPEDFFPTARALVQTESYLREWIGRFFYMLKPL